MGFWQLVLTIIAVGLAIVLSFQSKHLYDLRLALKRVRKEKNDGDEFMRLFSSGVSSPEGLSGAMNSVARYVCDQLSAGSVAIYDLEDDYLSASGVSGLYPLVHVHGGILSAKRYQLLELLRREHIKLGSGFIGTVAAERRELLIPNAGLDSRLAEYPEFSGSLVIIPLALDNGILTGLVVAASRDSGRGTFHTAQLNRLHELSPQIVMAQHLVRSYAEISRRQRIDQELDFARQIQFSLLPKEFPSWDQFSVNAFTRSAKEVNGDFYDFVEIDSNRLLIVLGDACGKGVPACMLTAMTRSFVRGTVDHFTTLSEFIAEINAKLYRDTEEERFVTLACCLLDKRNGLLEYGRAGHTELLTFVHDHIRVIYPDGPALGLLPPDLVEFDTICLAFQPGMSLLLYSDGINEALNGDDEEFGLARLSQVFESSCSDGDEPQETINLILDAVGTFAVEQTDDQTLILIQHT